MFHVPTIKPIAGRIDPRNGPNPQSVSRAAAVDGERYRCDNGPPGLDLYPLSCCLSVELPGIEPEPLPGKMPSELLFRYVSFPFSPARYLRLRFRVLTASRGSLVQTRVEIIAVPFERIV